MNQQRNHHWEANPIQIGRCPICASLSEIYLERETLNEPGTNSIIRTYCGECYTLKERDPMELFIEFLLQFAKEASSDD